MGPVTGCPKAKNLQNCRKKVNMSSQSQPGHVNIPSVDVLQEKADAGQNMHTYKNTSYHTARPEHAYLQEYQLPHSQTRNKDTAMEKRSNSLKHISPCRTLIHLFRDGDSSMCIFVFINLATLLSLYKDLKPPEKSESIN